MPVARVKEKPAPPDLKDIQQRIRQLEQKKAVAEDRKQRAEAERERIIKHCREQYDLTPEELDGKIEELRKSIEKKTVELSGVVAKIEEAVTDATA